jgi:branched-subunit amino acid permease
MCIILSFGPAGIGLTCNHIAEACLDAMVGVIVAFGELWLIKLLEQAT